MSFVKEFHRGTKPTALLVTILGSEYQKTLLRFLKFDILRIPPIQIPTKKGQTLSFVKKISPSP
jgi:hypothetical protein